VINFPTAKELKAIAEVGTTLGYSGDELKQYVNDERMRMDKEKELERQRKEAEQKAERLLDNNWLITNTNAIIQYNCKPTVPKSRTRPPNTLQ